MKKCDDDTAKNKSNQMQDKWLSSRDKMTKIKVFFEPKEGMTDEGQDQLVSRDVSIMLIGED